MRCDTCHGPLDRPRCAACASPELVQALDAERQRIARQLVAQLRQPTERQQWTLRQAWGKTL